MFFGRAAAGAAEDFRGDLKAVKELPGASSRDLGGADGIQHLGDGDLDGGAIVEDRELERFLLCAALALRGAAARGVEIAIGHATHGGRVALGPIGHDVTAFRVHNPAPSSEIL